jgi:hypothetical protein
MKNITVLICASLIFLSQSLYAVPSASLLLPNGLVMVGDDFEIQLILDGDGIGEELLAFGLDVLADNGVVSYQGFSLTADFTDASFGASNISAFAFPGVADNIVLLATLSYKALTEGFAMIGVEGIFDGIFNGLYYQQSSFDLTAQASITVVAKSSTPSIDEPSHLLYSLIGLLLILISIKRKRLKD